MHLIEKRPWIIVLIICLVLYFQNSWVPGMFHDGYLYIAFGKNAAEKGHWLVPFLSETEYPKFDQHPPLYFILEGIWFKIFNFSWTSARVYGLLWMLAAALAFFHLLRRKMGERLALTSSIVLLLMPSLLKKARFPNLDFPLLLFSILIFLSLFNIKKERPEKTWLFIGLIGGLALLIKGAGALFILGIVGLFLLLSKEDREQLKTPWPYIGLVLSFALFALWPLALKQRGEFRVFEGYMSGQVFGSLIKGRNLKEIDYFLYFKHLLKTTLPFILLGLWKYKSFKEKETRLFLLASIWLGLPLIVFSFMKVKFSNYLI
ncbi:MAG: glycosyltransferase family 39 protein, partial [Halobacteriovoraceae bacterium]|nr:glycosyltransferase family 39 protein [Halobacteriovoraceae bacterium]